MVGGRNGEGVGEEIVEWFGEDVGDVKDKGFGGRGRAKESGNVSGKELRNQSYKWSQK